MILRVVHGAVPPEKKAAFIEFINKTLAPAIRKMPGCRFIYVADCVEKHHEHEVIYVSGWDSEEACAAMDNASAPARSGVVYNFFSMGFPQSICQDAASWPPAARR